MNGYTFKRLDRSAKGVIPDHTCPDIDSVIGILEELRKANSELRDAAEYWKGECEEACDERDRLEDSLSSAHEEMAELKKELGSK